MRELVMLSDVPPTREQQYDVAGTIMPGGTYVELRGGELAMFVDPAKTHVLAVYETKPVHVRDAAAAVLADPPRSFGLWTEMTIPFDDAGYGRRIADAITAAVGGTIVERD